MVNNKKTLLNLSIVFLLVAFLLLTAASSLQPKIVQAQDWNTLRVTINGIGQVIVNPVKEYYSFGDEVTLTAVPGPGWSFSFWSGDGTGIGTTRTVTVTGNMAVTATFTQNSYTVDVTVNPSSSAGTVTGYVNNSNLPLR